MSDVNGDGVTRTTTDAEVLAMLLDEPATPRRRWLPVVVVVLVLLAGAGVVYGVLVRDTGPPHPDSWDPRVAPLAEAVAKERGLDFEYAVYVDFLDEEEFTEKVTADDEDLTDEDREQIEQATGLLRAVGLIEGELDLFETSNKLRGAGIVGYYSVEDGLSEEERTEVEEDLEARSDGYDRKRPRSRSRRC